MPQERGEFLDTRSDGWRQTLDRDEVLDRSDPHEGVNEIVVVVHRGDDGRFDDNDGCGQRVEIDAQLNRPHSHDLGLGDRFGTAGDLTGEHLTRIAVEGDDVTVGEGSTTDVHPVVMDGDGTRSDHGWDVPSTSRARRAVILRLVDIIADAIRAPQAAMRSGILTQSHLEPIVSPS